LTMRFFPESERIFHMKVSCQCGFVVTIKFVHFRGKNT
jgi:hypothetical protein